MAFPPSPLNDACCYLFVIGPDVGETILLRFPQGDWVVIDSFTHESRPAADAVIRKYGGRVEAVVLTHPHQDHCSGVLELLEEYAPRIIGCVHPRSEGAVNPLPVDPMALFQERARPTYDRIWELWRESSQRKWQTFRDQGVQIGAATLKSLHPVRPASSRAWQSSTLNDLSSAMLLEWHGLRVLLGADATRNAWNSMAAEFSDLADHAAMKVPHHGSKGAIHAAFARGPRDRLWIVTPFKTKRLPRAEDREGMDLLLEHNDRLQLTALPFRHDLEGETPCVTTRQDILHNVRPRRIEPREDDALDRLDSHVIVAFDRSGSVQEMWHGRGTVSVFG